MPETAAIARSRFTRAPRTPPPALRASRDALHLRFVSRRSIDADHHLEGERLVAHCPNLDAVRSRIEVQALEDAVEIVDDADVVAVDVDFGVARLDLQPQAPLV